MLGRPQIQKTEADHVYETGRLQVSLESGSPAFRFVLQHDPVSFVHRRSRIACSRSDHRTCPVNHLLFPRCRYDNQPTGRSSNMPIGNVRMPLLPFQFQPGQF